FSRHGESTGFSRWSVQFFVLLRQKYIVNQNRYASRRLYHQCDKVFQPAHFRQLCAITFFGGLRKNFLKKISKNFFL
ncbi:hypothetical protein, partial [Desulfovibrio sp.]